MIRLLYVLAFIIPLLLGLVLGIPLSFALKSSGINQKGVSWQQARGTIWKGQVTGLGFLNYDLGSVEISSKPLAVISGHFDGDFDWQSRAGRAKGHLTASKQTVKLTGLNANIFVSSLDDLHPELRRIGGVLSTKDATIVAGMTGKCISASGSSRLDMLQRLGEQYGREWPVLNGNISCDAGALSLPLKGRGENDETFEVTLTFDGNSTASLTIQANGLDAMATAAIQSIGFEPSDSGYEYNQTTNFMDLK